MRLITGAVRPDGPLCGFDGLDPNLSAELSEKELVNALPVLEKLRHYLDAHRLSA